MTCVGITGAGGYIGQKLIAHLDNQPWCTRILGTDLRAPQTTSEKLTFLKEDIRSPKLFDFFKEPKVDVLVHLAFVLNPIHDEKEMHDININGTLKVLDICHRLEVGHVVVASSGVAYGAWPDNPEPITEDHPIRVFLPSFNYAHHKGLVELHCAEYLKKHPGTVFNIVRPSIVYGPNTRNYLARFWKKLPVFPLADGQDPKVQYVHEEDVVDFFVLLLEKKVPGAFNLGGDGVLRTTEVARMINKKTLRLPMWLVKGLVGLAWKLHLPMIEAPAGSVNYLAYPWVLDTTRAKNLLGWTPRFSTLDTVRIMFQTHGFGLKS